MISTVVVGDPASVQGLARWLRCSLLLATSDAAALTVSARSSSAGRWEGEAAEGYREAAGGVVALTDQHCARVERAAYLVDAYASHLADVQAQMASIRERATAGGLVVADDLVLPPRPEPVPTPVPPPGASAAGVAAHGRQVEAYAAWTARRALYDALASEAVEVLARHVEWVETYLAAAPEELAAEASGVDQLHAALASTPAGLLVTGVLAARTHSLTASLAPLSQQLDELRGHQRSGSPARAALASHPLVTQRRTEVLDRIDRVNFLLRVTGPAGLAYELYSDVVAIGDGASPGRTAAQTGGGVLGAFYGAAIGTVVVGAATTTAPVWLTAVVVGAAAAGGAYLLSEGFGTLWDNASDDLTDTIDDGLSSAWEWITEPVS